MAVLVNRAKMTTATTGTGTITLGSASAGYQTFADAGVADAEVVRYVVEDGNDWEIGTGTYTASGTTLSRTVSESSNADSAITLTGAATVFVSAVAADLNPDIAALAVTDGNIIVGDGTAWVAENGATARTSLGVTIGTNVQAHGAVLDDLNTLGANAADGEVAVGTGAGALAWESGATLRTSIGVGTGDSPQVTGIELGHATDTTLTRSGAGQLAVEGVDVAMQGAIVPADLANGTDGELITWDAAGAPAVVAAGTATHVLTSNGAGAAPTFQAASGGGEFGFENFDIQTSGVTWDVPTGVTEHYVIGFGGGGGGGPYKADTNDNGGLGGDGAIFIIRYIGDTPGTTYTTAVGAGGATVSGHADTQQADGSPGTGTTFDGVTAGGGAGGQAGDGGNGANGANGSVSGTVTNSADGTLLWSGSSSNNIKVSLAAIPMAQSLFDDLLAVLNQDSGSSAHGATTALAYTTSIAWLPGTGGYEGRFNTLSNANGGVDGVIFHIY